MNKNVFLKYLYALVCCLLIVMIMATTSTIVLAAQINAHIDTLNEENVEVNVYDAESLKSYLQVENVDIVLWLDVTIGESVSASCNSIDLNGYTLTLSSLTLNSNKKSFSILDSSYDEIDKTSTGKLKIIDRFSIGDSTLIVQNGVVNVSNGIAGSGNVEIYDGIITVHGKNGSNGSHGTNGKRGFNTLEPSQYDRPTDGTSGANGFDGDSGSHGIQVANLYIYGGEVTVVGGNGGNGGNGGHGGDGGSDDNSYSCANYWGGDGGNGGSAGDGGKSGIGMVVTGDIVLYSGALSVTGGTGGSGGNGGSGGYGGRGDYPVSSNRNYPGGKGGNGGNGGNGGSNSYGGEAILATNFIIYDGHVTAIGGNEGTAGVGGSRGSGGSGGTGSGTAGTSGDNGAFCGNGGAGINANVTIYGGTVTAIGGNGAAGIGGSGYTSEISGHDVNVCGGNIVVTAGSNAFDIGGGYNGTSMGAAGTLTVTGGTIKFCTAGRATNVSNPSYVNCTVTGAGAYQHEGTYDNNGKFSIAVQSITITPEMCVGYDKVELKAALNISRTSNISTPAPKGYISFKLDGNEIGTATIENSALVGNQIVANASVDWIAVEGNHVITAEYIAGANDKYASAGIFEFEPDVTVHTHEWEDDFFVDINPTCLTAGSKSIHCKICGAQKNITEIPAIGHNYVNNQCENCKEYLPLIVFKDYDGTILNSTYYYIGDAISVPNDPTRDEDNTYTYEFIGWDKEIVECDGDKTYTAVYESIHKNYTVIFQNWDNSVVLTKDDYHYGDVVVPPTILPTKPSDKIGDYIFAGWDSPVGTCEGDKVYIATYSTSYKYYTVEFRDWNNQIISSNTYKYGEVIEVPENPSKQADMVGSYIFNGWDKNITVCDGNKVYIATYLTNYIDYTVTFKDWDNSIINTKTYHYGDVVTAPDTPTRNADNTYTYTFKGWDKSVVSCAGNAIYTATYNSIYIDYTIIFKNEDGTVLSTDTYHYGGSVDIPETPTKAADNTYTYTFKDWGKSVSETCVGDAEYTANYAATYIEYDIRFLDWDGSLIQTVQYHYGDTITAIADPERESDETYTYTFLSWNKALGTCTGNASFTAQYESTFINYTVVFKDYDGSVISRKTYHFGDAITIPADPVRTSDDTYSYTFKDWGNISTSCNGNKEYTAVYKEKYIDYTVAFKDHDGSVISSQTYHFGDDVTAPQNPTRTADNTFTYAFAGWDKSVVACAGNATYTATYDSAYIDYTVIFKNEDGTVLSTNTYHYGDEVTVPSTPTKAADNTYTYTFKAWDAEVVACAGDATYTATYDSAYIDYTVIFKNEDGTVLSTNTYHYGDEITAPTAPTKEADDEYTYTFAGWDKEIVACAGNATYTATYISTEIEKSETTETTESETTETTESETTETTESETTEATEPATKETTEVETNGQMDNKPGCGGSISGSSIVFVALIGLGALQLTKKKKQD